MKRLVKRISVLVVIIALGIWLSPSLFSAFRHAPSDHDVIVKAFDDKTSNIMVEAEARVVLLLPDIEDLGRFQEFKVELENGHIVRVLHDLDEADRIPVAVSSQIRFRGEYDWSVDGGVIYWTHDDPIGEREGGWILHLGRKYL